jgi:hypothetical protein
MVEEQIPQDATTVAGRDSLRKCKRYPEKMPVGVGVSDERQRQQRQMRLLRRGVIRLMPANPFRRWITLIQDRVPQYRQESPCSFQANDGTLVDRQDHKVSVEDARSNLLGIFGGVHLPICLP